MRIEITAAELNSVVSFIKGTTVLLDISEDIKTGIVAQFNDENLQQTHDDGFRIEYYDAIRNVYVIEFHEDVIVKVYGALSKHTEKFATVINAGIAISEVLKKFTDLFKPFSKMVKDLFTEVQFDINEVEKELRGDEPSKKELAASESLEDKAVLVH